MNFKNYKSYLQVYTSQVRAGADKVNVREKLVSLDAVTFTNNFTNPVTGHNVVGNWIMDGGNLQLSKGEREKRHFAQKGMMSFSFTGTSLVLRVGVDSGWGVGQVFINGVRPSQLVAGSVDTVSCNADNYGVGLPGHQDVLVIDNLPLSTYNVSIYCENVGMDPGGWFAITAIKTFSFDNKTFSRDVWVASNSVHNKETFTFKNVSTRDIYNVWITLPLELVNEFGTTIAPIYVSQMAPNQEVVIDFYPKLTGAEQEGSEVHHITISAEYWDKTGTIIRERFVDMLANDPRITYIGDWWDDVVDSEVCKFTSSSVPWTIKIDEVYGYPNIRLYWDFNNAAANLYWDNHINQVSYAYWAEGGYPHIRVMDFPDYDGIFTGHYRGGDGVPAGWYQYPIMEVPTGYHDIKINYQPLYWLTGWFGISRLSFNELESFTKVTEELSITFNRKQVKPLPVTNVRIENGKITWDDPNPALTDSNIPASNIGVTEAQLEYRHPTFVVVYQDGWDDVIEQYDIAIVDPFAVSRDQVAKWQSMGIKVIAYVSFGEEDGTREIKWNLQSQDGFPYKGDGLGPGGYASYYMKAGYEYGEVSECTHDKQRMFGQKACALSKPQYNTGAGRCGTACTWDWRDGYKTQQAGGACGKGWTSSNNWIRTAETACHNTVCPNFAPINQKCPNYQKADNVWGQDFTTIETAWPDENGIWGSFYINPVTSGWKNRLLDFYLPAVFGTEQTYTQDITVAAQSDGTGTVFCFEVPHKPLDQARAVAVKTQDGTYTYIENVEYSYDTKEGVFIFANAATISGPAVAAGTIVSVTWTQKGLQADGVFMDTVDTVDVYPAATYQQKFADLINELKVVYPTKEFCSNRGFSILDKIIESCRYVMFESFLVDYDWETDTYKKITDQGAIDYNNDVANQLYDLRRKHKFDVLGLNYCHPTDTNLQEYIAQETRKHGWMSWDSVILLNHPRDNVEVKTEGAPITTSLWRVVRVKPISN